MIHRPEAGNLSRTAGSHSMEGTGTDPGAGAPDERLARLVEDHADLVFSLARRLTRSEEEAHDLFQESFVRIFRGLPTFEGRAALRTWICQIVINTDRNRRRWWSRLRRNLPSVPLAGADESEEGGPTALDPVDRAAGPERAAIGGEIRRRLDLTLASLPEEQRLAVVLRDVEGMSYEEIAGATGAEIGTVKSRIGRARAALRADLADLVDRPAGEKSR